jgi:hypothetical protein
MAAQKTPDLRVRLLLQLLEALPRHLLLRLHALLRLLLGARHLLVRHLLELGQARVRILLHALRLRPLLQGTAPPIS